MVNGKASGKVRPMDVVLRAYLESVSLRLEEGKEV